MTENPLSYRRTDSGSSALTSGDLSVPSDYRRLLGVIEAGRATHFDVIRGFLRQYPDDLLAAWLGELVELGFVESVAAAPSEGPDITGSFGAGSADAARAMLEDEDHLAGQAAATREALSRGGLAIAEDRLKHRERLDKAPADTVVLIVEDDPDQLALADLRTTMSGYSVRVARSAVELLAELRRDPEFDLLLLDAMLPDGDGFDILAQLRRSPHFALLPIVMLTAKDDLDDIRKGMALGADGYVTKPYSKDILGGMIRRVLGQPAPGPAAS